MSFRGSVFDVHIRLNRVKLLTTAFTNPHSGRLWTHRRIHCHCYIEIYWNSSEGFNEVQDNSQRSAGICSLVHIFTMGQNTELEWCAWKDSSSERIKTIKILPLKKESCSNKKCHPNHTVRILYTLLPGLCKVEQWITTHGMGENITDHLKGFTNVHSSLFLNPKYIS